MGYNFIDQYSLLHLASGIIAYFWDISLRTWIILHIMFEFMENTEAGMNVINNYITFWPGGKPRRDSDVNILGDNISAGVGWLLAQSVDVYGERAG